MTPKSRNSRRGRQARFLALVLLLGEVEARASGSDGFGVLILGAIGGVGTSVTFMGGSGSTALGASDPAVKIIAGALAVLSGSTSVGITLIFTKKDAVCQLKVDHETYLAGGAMTPMLQEVYRQVRLETSFYDREDPKTGSVGIDEERMGEAIDRLVGMVLIDPKTP